MFLHGPAGTGKSHLVRQLLDTHVDGPMYVTAMTALAAMLLGVRATTLHSWAGLVPNAEAHPLDLVLAALTQAPRTRMARARVLVVDEVSMLKVRGPHLGRVLRWLNRCRKGELLDLLDQLLRVVRDRDTPMGGLQVVLVGDLLQLPPIGGQRVFEAHVWPQLRLVPVLLNHVRCAPNL